MAATKIRVYEDDCDSSGDDALSVRHCQAGSDGVLRIVHLSDTHCSLRPDDLDWLPDADIFIHTGDYANDGRKDAQHELFNDVLEAVADRYPVRIVVLGNHDVMGCDKDRLDEVRHRAAKFLTGATHVLHHERLEVTVRDSCAPRSLVIYGCPWWPGHNWAYRVKTSVTSEREGARFEDIPSDVDILLTHGPSHGILDKAFFAHQGSVTLAQKLSTILHNGCHLHGHIHKCNGIVHLPTSLDPGSVRTIVNSAMINKMWHRTFTFSPHMVTVSYDAEKGAWDFAVRDIPLPC